MSAHNLVRSTATSPTASAASVIRDAVNEMGSILSIPARPNPNAVPQMRAVRVSRRLPISCFFFTSFF